MASGLTEEEEGEIRSAITQAPIDATNYVEAQLGPAEADNYFGNSMVTKAKVANRDPNNTTPVFFIKPYDLKKPTVLPRALYSLPHSLKKKLAMNMKKDDKARGRRRIRRTRRRNPNKNNHKNTYKQLPVPFVRRFRLRY